MANAGNELAVLCSRHLLHFQGAITRGLLFNTLFDDNAIPYIETMLHVYSVIKQHLDPPFAHATFMSSIQPIREELKRIIPGMENLHTFRATTNEKNIILNAWLMYQLHWPIPVMEMKTCPIRCDSMIEEIIEHHWRVFPYSGQMIVHYRSKTSEELLQISKLPNIKTTWSKYILFVEFFERAKREGPFADFLHLLMWDYLIQHPRCKYMATADYQLCICGALICSVKAFMKKLLTPGLARLFRGHNEEPHLMEFTEVLPNFTDVIVEKTLQFPTWANTTGHRTEKTHMKILIHGAIDGINVRMQGREGRDPRQYPCE